MSESSRLDAVMRRLHELAQPERIRGMASVGIHVGNALGVPVAELRRIARTHRRDHDLALALWASGIHEARLLAGMVADPRQVTDEQMESWVAELDSWDVCDQLCINLLVKTPFAWSKAMEWSGRDEEFAKRAGFALIAALAIHDKEADDARFLALLPVIEEATDDGRNYVKKAVSWALRHIGKRGVALNKAAVAAAQRISQRTSKAARWVASDALRELTGEKVQARLRR